MRLGKNERVIQVGLNIMAGLLIMSAHTNLAMKETLARMDVVEAKIYLDTLRRDGGFEYFNGDFYIPVGVWHKERKDEEA
ncbi:MAG: hypothetical protein ACXQT4_01650 [Methanotrichaceae archaeon]